MHVRWSEEVESERECNSILVLRWPSNVSKLRNINSASFKAGALFVMLQRWILETWKKGADSEKWNITELGVFELVVRSSLGRMCAPQLAQDKAAHLQFVSLFRCS